MRARRGSDGGLNSNKQSLSNDDSDIFGKRNANHQNNLSRNNHQRKTSFDGEEAMAREVQLFLDQQLKQSEQEIQNNNIEKKKWCCDEKRHVVCLAFNKIGWKCVENSNCIDWDLMWAVKRNFYLDYFQSIILKTKETKTETNITKKRKILVNHFPHHSQLTKKDNLAINLTPYSFSFLPKTFILPKQYSKFEIQFLEDREKKDKKNLWILKPSDKARGLGITLISNLNQIPNSLKQNENSIEKKKELNSAASHSESL